VLSIVPTVIDITIGDSDRLVARFSSNNVQRRSPPFCLRCNNEKSKNVQHRLLRITIYVFFSELTALLKLLCNPMYCARMSVNPWASPCCFDAQRHSISLQVTLLLTQPGVL